MDVDTWEHIFEVNPTGMFRCTKELDERVFDRDGTAAVVNVASVGSVIAFPYQTPYTASKHDVAGFTCGGYRMDAHNQGERGRPGVRRRRSRRASGRTRTSTRTSWPTSLGWFADLEDVAASGRLPRE